MGQYSYPTRPGSVEQLDELDATEEVVELLLDDAIEPTRSGGSELGAETLREIERRVMLSVIDQHWREHLYEMDYLREGINLRAMGQRDPLVEWQREGFDMFEAMMGHRSRTLRPLRLPPPGRSGEQPAPQAPQRQRTAPRRADPVQGSAAMRPRPPPVRPQGAPRCAAAAAQAQVPSTTSRPRHAAGRESTRLRPQRALLLRERQEVQALPRPLTA